MKTGHEAMLEWDKTFRHGHLPMWVRQAIKKDGSMIKPQMSLPACPQGGVYFEFWPCVEFDHWGSVLRDGFRIVVTQPYVRDDLAAQKFAKKVGCRVEVTSPGPWHPRTVMYSFLPNDKEAMERRKREAEKSRRWRKANPEKAQEKRKRWMEKNPEKAKLIKIQNEANRDKEKKSASDRRRYRENHAKIREVRRQAQNALPDCYIASRLGLSVKNLRKHPELIEAHREVIRIKRKLSINQNARKHEKSN